MRKTPTPAQWDLLVSITMSALPDSLRARKTALVTLLYALPRNYAGREHVSEALQGLRIHEAAQARFQFSQGGGK